MPFAKQFHRFPARDENPDMKTFASYLFKRGIVLITGIRYLGRVSTVLSLTSR